MSKLRLKTSNKLVISALNVINRAYNFKYELLMSKTRLLTLNISPKCQTQGFKRQIRALNVKCNI